MDDLTIDLVLYLIAIVGTGVFISVVPPLVGPPYASYAFIAGLVIMGIFLGYFLGS